MDLRYLTQLDEYTWRIEPTAGMRVPGVLYGDASLVREMDEKVRDQVSNVARLPGIVQASYAMPDAHWGYGFPIGGVAAFDATAGGVISAGGVGFDISCGVRTLHTGLRADSVLPHKARLVDLLFERIPAGVGSTGPIRLSDPDLDAMLEGGAVWAVDKGWGRREDLAHIEEGGRVSGARSDVVSDKAKNRQRGEMGTLGSGNHYLEVQRVTTIHHRPTADAFDLHPGDVLVSIHCGSRGLGHQIATDYQREMVDQAAAHGLQTGDRDLACAPLDSSLGREYLGAMRAGINCALANRQILTHLTRQAFTELFPESDLRLLYDVSHNTCKEETHSIDGRPRRLFVHRKGATRAFGPGHPDLPASYRETGQPVLIGGTMGTASYILAGIPESEPRALSSACHGAGRAMSRRQATRTWKGRGIVKELESRGILVRSPSLRGVAEEAPGAYKDVSAVVQATEQAGLARIVARLEPMVCIKG